MKKIFQILLIFLFSVQALSQGLGEKKEKIKAMRIAFIIEKLSLSPDEATKFWPLFKEFENKQEQIRRRQGRPLFDRLDLDIANNMSEKEAAALLQQIENTEEEQYQNRKKFVNNLKSVIPTIKIIKLLKVEEEFKRRLLKQYRDRKND